MTPIDVNAYYAPWKNMIVFPAGILQTPYTGSNQTFVIHYVYVDFSILIFLFHSILDRSHRLLVVSELCTKKHILIIISDELIHAFDARHVQFLH
jgi:hypothetical protein